MDKVVEVKGVKLLAAKVEGVDMNGLRDLGDQLKGKAWRRCCPSCSSKRWQGKSSCNGNGCSTESRRSCRKPDQSSGSDRWRWRRRTSEHGSGRRKESGKSQEAMEAAAGILEKSSQNNKVVREI